MEINIPEFCLVALVGTSGSGKSTFAARHFLASEVISSDMCRALVSDDETDQGATDDAFDVLEHIARKRLARRKLTVIDATNVQQDARKNVLKLAKENDCFAVAIVLNLPESVCQERNRGRENRNFGTHVIRRQKQLLRRSLGNLKREGFRHVFILDDETTIESVRINRTKLWTDRSEERGPFDIIGDIHGCFDELIELFEKLGYDIDRTAGDDMNIVVTPPPGRKAIFLGDLVDRGPKSPEVLNLVMNMVEAEQAICVPGNHDVKLAKKLDGRNVKIAYGLAETLEQLEKQPPEFSHKCKEFITGLVSHFILDAGKLVVSHAGMKASYQGRSSGRVREFALYGDTTGETDEYGLPVRYEWANDYRGEAHVIYGHTPVGEAEWINRTMNIDTGCVFGGRLTALRYPEKELVSVDAHREYYESIKPFKTEDLEKLDDEDAPNAGAGTTAESCSESGNRSMMSTPRPAASTGLRSASREGDLLDLDDVFGKRRIEIKYVPGTKNIITIKEENAAAALETISRFAIDPKWLIYLPPTMSPCETSRANLEGDGTAEDIGGYLERPEEAFEYYSSREVFDVVCQEKHMGSRAVVIVCASKEAAAKRFSTSYDGAGVVYTRTGRRFFTEEDLEREFIEAVQEALGKSDFWKRFETDWVALDCELMPWSKKARDLLRDQYAHTGAAARASLDRVNKELALASARGLEIDELVQRFSEKEKLCNLYVEAYQRYCWDVNSLKDLKLAPFHILATEEHCHFDRDHLWHMAEIEKINSLGGDLFQTTAWIKLDISREDEVRRGALWWEQLTDTSTFFKEGIVVKPLNFLARHKGNLIQPAIKCRGREYLRIIYGPEYTQKENLERLRNRGLSRKRALAMREFTLGMEALESFVRHEPLYKVHECVFGTLALESEPVDPRL